MTHLHLEIHLLRQRRDQVVLVQDRDGGVRLDQFGGDRCPERILELVESGQLTQTRLDQSVRRVLKEKFQLGLFDDPEIGKVDEELAQLAAVRADHLEGHVDHRPHRLLADLGALPVEVEPLGPHPPRAGHRDEDQPDRLALLLVLGRIERAEVPPDDVEERLVRAQWRRHRPVR